MCRFLPCKSLNTECDANNIILMLTSAFFYHHCCQLLQPNTHCCVWQVNEKSETRARKHIWALMQLLPPPPPPFPWWWKKHIECDLRDYRGTFVFAFVLLLPLMWWREKKKKKKTGGRGCLNHSWFMTHLTSHSLWQYAHYRYVRHTFLRGALLMWALFNKSRNTKKKSYLFPLSLFLSCLLFILFCFALLHFFPLQFQVCIPHLVGRAVPGTVMRRD